MLLGRDPEVAAIIPKQTNLFTVDNLPYRPGG